MSRRRQFARDLDHDITTIQVAPETPCPGQCNRAFRQAEETGSDHDVPFHPGRPVWCRDVDQLDHRGDPTGALAHSGCFERITADLAAIPALAVHLGPGRLNIPRDVNAQPHGALSHSPSPSPAWDTADGLIRWAVTLEDGLRFRIGHPPRVEMWRDLASAVRYLTAYAGPLLGDVATAEQVGRQVMRYRRVLDLQTGRVGLVHELTGTCGACKRRGRLFRRDGDDLVRCSACPAVMAWELWELRVRQAGYAERLRKRAS